MSSDKPQDDQPLGLTVHSLPSPMDVAQPLSRRGRWKMFLILLVCAAPVVASYFTYYVIRPEGRRNFGALIEPQRPLPDIVGVTLEGQSVNLRSLKGQWLLISVASGDCNAMCQSYLYYQRQLREGLGKDKDRVDWVWLVSDLTPLSPNLLPALKQATVLRVPSAELSQWLEPQPGHHLAEHLYLVDPIGNWMMRFPAGLDQQNAHSVKRDLERLMRASAFWDTPGR
jgi:hypothetical protein